MVKFLVIGLVIGIFLIGSVCAYNVIGWSNSKVIHENKDITIIKKDCPRDEWNDNFDLFRSGEISKEDMKIYVRSCKW